MITTKEIKLKKTKEFKSKYIEEELKKMGFDVLRWAIADYDENSYTLNLAIIEA